MALTLQSVTFLSPDPRRDAEFWGAVLGRSAEVDRDGILLAGTTTQVGLRFEAGPGHGAAKNRLHLHLTDGERTQRDTIDACIALGGRLLGNGHVPEDSYAVMADPVGDEFCVIEDGNAYLTGCGPLGEVTCDGTRVVGLFWAEALGWPLVWEVGEERVIQSPAANRSRPTRMSIASTSSSPSTRPSSNTRSIGWCRWERDSTHRRLPRSGPFATRMAPPSSCEPRRVEPWPSPRRTASAASCSPMER